MINAGMVSVENGRKDGGPNDYVPTKKVRVDLSFIVETPDQAEATLDRVLAIANDRVNRALGRETANKVTLGEQIAHAATAANEAVDLAKVKDAAFTAKVKEQIAAEKEARGKEANALAAEAAPAETLAKGSAKSTDAIVIDTTLPAAFKRVKADPVVADPAAVVEPPKPAVEAPKAAVISDADIMKAITTINAQVKNPKAIVTLIHKHTAELAPEKHTASQIPQDRRAQFIDDLELLKVSGPTVA